MAANPTQTIRADSAQWMIRQSNAIGLSTDRLIQDTGLSMDWVNQNNALVTQAQYCKLIQNALDISRDPALGLRFGNQIDLSEFGFFMYAVMSSETYGESLKVYQRYWEVAGQLLNFSIETTAQNLILTFSSASALVRDRVLVYLIEEAFSSTKVGSEFVSQQPTQFDKLCFAYPEPGHVALYSQLFNCPLYFDQQKNQIFISIIDGKLNEPLPSGNPEVAPLLRQQCEKLLADLRSSDEFVDTIRTILMDSLGNFPVSKDVAKEMGFSRAGFYRQLNQRNTTFQKILDEVRSEIAMKYLSETNLTIADISDLMGFSEPTTFRQAFKKWTGQSASLYRKNNYLF